MVDVKEIAGIPVTETIKYLGIKCIVMKRIRFNQSKIYARISRLFEG